MNREQRERVRAEPFNCRSRLKIRGIKIYAASDIGEDINWLALWVEPGGNCALLRLPQMHSPH